MKYLYGIICALVALRAGADTLGDLKVAVERLSAKQPVRATFSAEGSVKSAGRFANANSARLATAEVSHDGTGVSITIPQALLDRAAHEARTRTAGDTPAQNAIGSIRSHAIVEALNFRDALLTMLDGATVIEEKRVSFRGQPARLLVLQLNRKPGREDGVIRIGSVKNDERLNLWVGDDNLPIAADHTQKTTAGFMFVKGSFSGRASYTFAHTADRLILARVETSDSGSGMGQKVEKVSVETLTLH